jgi:CCR4-NOT transcription complex subunit 1
LASLKESIRPAILSNLKTFLQISELPNPFSDSIWLGLIEENIENITGFIEQGTAERVLSDFDQLFSNEWISSERSTSIDGPISYEAYESIFESRNYNRSNMLSLNSIKSIVPGEYDQLVASLRHLSSQPMRSESIPDNQPSVDVQSVPEIMDIFIKLLNLIEKACQSANDTNVSKLDPENDVRKLMKQIIPLASSLPSHRDELCLLMCQRLMQLLYKNLNPLFSDVIILLLVKIFEFSAKVAKEVTTWIIYSDDDRKYNVLATWALFNSGLVYVLDYDAQMARQIEKSPEVSLKFAIELIRKCVFEEPAVAAPYDFVYSLESLKNIYAKSSIDEIKNLLDDLSTKTKSLSSKDSNNSRESVLFCFTDWFRLCQYPSISEKLVDSFMSQLFEYGFFQLESTAKVFFQVCTETAVEIYVRQRRSPAILAYRSIEAYAKLVANIFKFTSKPVSKASNNLSTWELLIINLKIFGVILAQGLEQNMDYLQKPFSRFITCLLSEISKDEILAKNPQVLEIIGEFLISMSPLKLPKFCFAWFEAVCHPSFLELFLKNSSSQELVVKCIIEVLDFLKPISNLGTFTEPACVYLKGLSKLFAVIIHDSPELFVKHCLELCDHIPNRFVQLKNIVLAAVPRDVVLPDPLSPGLKIDTLPGIRSKPDIDFEYSLKYFEDDLLYTLVDDCLAQGTNPIPSTINNIVAKLGAPRICNAFINLLASRVSSSINEASFKSSNALLFAVIISPGLSPEPRYNILCAMANHLRYPNYLTYFFSFSYLHAFRQIGPMNDSIKSQIVRVLLERLVAYRPHPWGLMITFMELIRNPEYRFWNQGIVKSSPEIEKMFENVAKSCLVNIPVA